MNQELPLSIRSNANVSTAAKFMLFWDVDALGVVDPDEDEVRGTLTERDLIRFLATGRDLFDTSVEELIDNHSMVEPVDVTGRERSISARPVPIRDYAAREIMSSPGIACHEEVFFEEVAEVLADREISGMPVVNGKGEVVGVISERDLAHALGGPLIRLAIRRPVRSGPFLRGPRGVAAGARRAKDVMTSPAVVAHPETPMHALAGLMVKEQVNRIPIVRAKRLVGVVTRGDILGAIAGLRHREVELDQAPVVIGSGVLNCKFEAGSAP